MKRDLKKGTVTITTDKISSNLVQVQNTLTQRTLFPGCEAGVTVDASGIKDGDYAGLCLLESNYGFIAVTKRDSSYYLVMGKRELETKDIWGERCDDKPFEEVECIPLDSPGVTLYAGVCFDSVTVQRSEHSSLIPNADDTVSFFYASKSEHPKQVKKIGSDHKLEFKLDHFTGARFGLFIYSTKEIGGSARFSDFIYRSENEEQYSRCGSSHQNLRGNSEKYP